MNVLYPISAFAGKFCIQWDFDDGGRKQDGYEEDFRGEKNWGNRCLKKAPEKIESTSGMDINIVYSPAEIPDLNYLTDIGFPGEYPFTRGIQLSRSHDPTKVRTQSLLRGRGQDGGTILGTF